MRYTSAHKDKTFQHIVDVASGLFKEQGIDATGIAVIMKKAGLTNGAFYAHFASKEALVEAVIADQLQKQIDLFQRTPKNIEGVKMIIDTYLAPEHRDNCSEGCPSAALLEEISRRSTPTRKTYTAEMLLLVDSFQEHFSILNPEQVRSLVFALISLLIGTLQLARTLTDHKLSDFVLASGREAAYSLIKAT